MSRIEKALERASQLRQKETVKPSATSSAPTVRINSIPTTFPQQAVAVPINNPLLVSITDPVSPIAEEYRKLKSAIVGMSLQKEFANVIMITSAIAGEGKTITAINLAISLAQELDHTVLLIDADLRKPAIHRHFGYDARVGLAEIIEGRAEVGEALIHTGIGKLVILPAGKVTLNPVELFSSSRMAQFLLEIKQRYPDRFVIVDTPPILPFAETRTLSRLVDGVVFIVKEGLASQSNIRDAVGLIEKSSIVGLVYNGAHLTSVDDRYGQYYGADGYNRAKEKPRNILQTKVKR